MFMNPGIDGDKGSKKETKISFEFIVNLLREDFVRNSLISLGWIPPKENKTSLVEKDVILGDTYTKTTTKITPETITEITTHVRRKNKKELEFKKEEK